MVVLLTGLLGWLTTAPVYGEWLLSDASWETLLASLSEIDSGLTMSDVSTSALAAHFASERSALLMEKQTLDEREQASNERERALLRREQFSQALSIEVTNLKGDLERAHQQGMLTLALAGGIGLVVGALVGLTMGGAL